MRLEVLSDQGDTLRMSLIHTFLLTAYLYTTFVMVSFFSIRINFCLYIFCAIISINITKKYKTINF